MSSIQRVLSASAAAWVRLLLAGVTQLFLVPIFLSHWSVEQYGCWLLIQAVGVFASILSMSYQNFVGFEFLKIGGNQTEQLRRLFYSALPTLLLIAFAELALLAMLVSLLLPVFDAHQLMQPELSHSGGWSLLVNAASWLIGSIGGLAGRALNACGQYPRVSWWNTLVLLIASVTTAVAVALGSGLLATVAAAALLTLVVYVPFYWDLWHQLRRLGILPTAPDWALGARSARHSLAIAATALLDISRQQGVRLILGALSGVPNMAAFATMRTISNVSQQAVGTITNPSLPELMRLLRERDTARVNAAMGIIWLLSVVLLSPLLVAFQWLMPGLFQAWTRGKLEFDPVLFGLFSLTLLAFSLARPCASILQGNNLLRPQLYIAMAMCALAIPAIVVLTRAFGIAGAGAAMLLTEVMGTAAIIWCARLWLTSKGIAFPSRLFLTSLLSIATATVAIAAVAWFEARADIAVGLAILVSVALGWRGLRGIPVGRMRKWPSPQTRG